MNPLMNLTHCVYVLRSLTDGNMYIGYSASLEHRLSDHFNGKVQSTAPRRPLKLIHVEYYLFEDDARRREGYLKTTKGKRALKLMIRDS